MNSALVTLSFELNDMSTIENLNYGGVEEILASLLSVEYTNAQQSSSL